ncbi:MAG: tRNA (adenosine(37)-N6)-threonylcarbamoyltransferase complex transferase subunit TsaD [Candidatus Zambryskibacteria bacterium]|nr:tRNA (adenosine(37)-N6)-threonylcarbamoyltransferase complex transferase subunit TsaD [Candidatus Zambryskibacteria bacterium]
MIILGIETSCDETAISIIEAKGDLKTPRFKVLSSTVNSQIDIHKEYGGVVPNLAKREHQRNLLPVLIDTLRKANLLEIRDTEYEVRENKDPKENLENFLNKVPKLAIDLIAVTVGPGLEPALWAGINFAKKIGERWNIPIIGANHMEGHIVSVLIDREETIVFPALALLISGGHTELVLLKDWTDKEKLGETQDDAVGEAFDKVARMLGLSYPGGPEISRLAEEAREKNIKLETRLPRPMIHSKDFNFSFSGLKTATLYYLKNNNNANKIAVAREFEDAVIETLLSKTKAAIEKYSPKTLIIGGGVIANKALRENFLQFNKSYPDIKILIPPQSLATDNATMIAITGYLQKLKSQNQNLKAQGNLSFN